MKFDIETLKTIVKSLEENDITEFEFESEDLKLKLKRGEEAPQIVAHAPVHHQHMAAAPVTHHQAAAKTAEAPVAEDTCNSHAVTSPMVGTFYAKPSPDADVFVKEGESVTEGQVLCIVEAMKMMNEIKADKSGVISKVLLTDGTAVKKGDKLFLID